MDNWLAKGIYKNTDLDLLVSIATNGTIVYVNAGNNPQLFCKAKDDTFTRQVRTGIALGIDDKQAYMQVIVGFDPGDFIFLYVDGLFDALMGKNQPFGKEKLNSVINQYKYATDEELLIALALEL